MAARGRCAYFRPRARLAADIHRTSPHIILRRIASPRTTLHHPTHPIHLTANFNASSAGLWPGYLGLRPASGKGTSAFGQKDRPLATMPRTWSRKSLAWLSAREANSPAFGQDTPAFGFPLARIPRSSARKTGLWPRCSGLGPGHPPLGFQPGKPHPPALGQDTPAFGPPLARIPRPSARKTGLWPRCELLA